MVEVSEKGGEKKKKKKQEGEGRRGGNGSDIGEIRHSSGRVRRIVIDLFGLKIKEAD